jgi:hypothetical protein
VTLHFVRDAGSDLITAHLRSDLCNLRRWRKSDECSFGRRYFVQIRSLIITSLMLLAPHAESRPAAHVDAPSEPRTSVAILELFTSEGCSSCPPADALLQRVHFKQLSAGQLIVGLSEHVTYWNSLGWKDQYSEQIFTNRQSVYASRLSPDGPYTPQMVLNGRDQFIGSDSGALEQALRTEVHRKQVDLRIASLVPQGDGEELKFGLAGSASKPLDIIAVLTDDVDQSNVLRGENSGRSLHHVSVARSLSRIATLNGDADQSVHLSLPRDFQPHTPGHHLVLFAQEAHQGAIVGAAVMPI